jgi:hypothetical protein
LEESVRDMRAMAAAEAARAVSADDAAQLRNCMNAPMLEQEAVAARWVGVDVY